MECLLCEIINTYDALKSSLWVTDPQQKAIQKVGRSVQTLGSRSLYGPLLLYAQTRQSYIAYFALTVHSHPLSRPIMHFQWGRNPFPAIGDAAYRKHGGGGPSHGHRQHAHKFGKDRACGSGLRYPRGQTDRPTDRSQYFATAPAPSLHRFRDIAFDMSKIAIFGYPSYV